MIPASGAPRVRPLRAIALRWWAVLTAVVVWQLVVDLRDVSPLVAVPPTEVAGELARARWLVGPMAKTLATAFVGQLAGMVLGAALAVVCWWSRFGRGVVTPLAFLFRTTPIVAFLPIVVRGLGYSTSTVVVVAALVGFFPTYVLVLAGMSRTAATANDLFVVFGSSRGQQLRRLAIPSAVPNLFVALRVSSSASILAALGAEYLVGTSGVGRLLRELQYTLDTQRCWAVAVAIALTSVVTYEMATRTEAWALRRFG